jgi:hypothetical protein
VGKRLIAVVVNPMHHTNSTSITDWALRKAGSELHLVQRYTTQFWSVLARAGTRVPISASPTDEELVAAVTERHALGDTVLVAPLVSRHFDFLETLISGGGLPLSSAVLHEALNRSILLLGSAPVGPTTIERLQRYAGRLPTVRFGSTETCLQVMGTPLYLDEKERLSAFQAGWAHVYNGQPQVGYYIGRPHPPFTECRIVRSLERGAGGEFTDCDDGEPGQLITRGDNLMSGYVGNAPATAKALGADGWYTNLGDVCFRLRSAVRLDELFERAHVEHARCQGVTTPNVRACRAAALQDGDFDYYWLSRDSALLIRGGANYAYEQINEELKAFITKTYSVEPEVRAVRACHSRVPSLPRLLERVRTATLA